LTVEHSSWRSEFWAGVRAAIPLLIGAIPFSVLFGALAISGGLFEMGRQLLGCWFGCPAGGLA
jgi:predicted branched-subunit amino acid permease